MTAVVSAPSPARPPLLLPFAKMIYDVRSEYYQTFLSQKQGSGMPKDTKPATPATASAATGDAMDTQD